jgi:glycosyltransferase involved in cell wall biosynthesis
MTNAVIEAMAAGIPTVALNRGNTAAVIRHGETGMLANSVDVVADHMVTIAEDQDLRIKLGKSSRALVENEFPRVQDRIKREVDLVLTLIESGGGSK